MLWSSSEVYYVHSLVKFFFLIICVKILIGILGAETELALLHANLLAEQMYINNVLFLYLRFPLSP